MIKLPQGKEDQVVTFIVLENKRDESLKVYREKKSQNRKINSLVIIENERYRGDNERSYNRKEYVREEAKNEDEISEGHIENVKKKRSDEKECQCK